jgi:hypothetical protein
VGGSPLSARRRSKEGMMTDADYLKLIKKHTNELRRIREQRAELELLEVHLSKKIESLEADRVKQEIQERAQ